MAKQYKLIVEVRQGFNLVDKKWIGGHAAFVEVRVNGETQKTHESDNLENPKWNSRLNFMLDSIPEKIVIEVKEMRTLLPKPKLGDYTINIKNQLNPENLLQSYTIQDGIIDLQNTKSGRLDLNIIIQSTDSEQVKTALLTSNVQEKEIVMEKSAEIEQKNIHEEKPVAKEQQQQQQQQEDILQNTNQVVQEEPIITEQKNLKQHIYEKIAPEVYTEQVLHETEIKK